jgi:hypothetical protein
LPKTRKNIEVLSKLESSLKTQLQTQNRISQAFEEQIKRLLKQRTEEISVGKREIMESLPKDEDDDSEEDEDEDEEED